MGQDAIDQDVVDIEPGGLRDDGQPGEDPARTLGPWALRTLHLDLLGRPPFAKAHEHWLGRSFEELVEQLLGSEEFWRQWIEEQLYFFLLVDNFRPDPERLAEMPRALVEGRLNMREAIHRIALSPTFDLRNPGADTFVTVVMEQLCGLQVQKSPRELEIAKRIYDGVQGSFLGRTGSSQADIVRIAVESREAARALAAREYERHVHEAPDAEVLREWSQSLQTDPAKYLELLRAALSSDAYRARLENSVPMPNRLFVRSLFVDLMDRLPTDEEAEPLREALDGLGDSAPLRSVLARLMLDSGWADLPALAAIHDHRAFVTERFRRMLGREASEEELETFLTAMADPACRTETVLYAVLSHPEYHRF